MKRSEAARKIREFLLNKRLDGDWEYQILEAVELIGMLPPHYTTIEKSSSGYGNDRYEEFTMSHFGWEPENE